MDVIEKKIQIEDSDLLTLLGYNDTNLSQIENRFHSAITVRGNNIIIKGEAEEIKAIEKVFNELIYILKRSGSINSKDISTVLDLVENGNHKRESFAPNNEVIIYYGYKDVIKPRSAKQLEYYNKVLHNDLVFAIGPAGTGKTFLAVAIALSLLKENNISKIILSRPAVEAGESLGFLPGDLREKIDPYLKPLTDALFYMMNPEKLKNYMEKNIIEIIPLAYMRGRTLNNCMIILDEAQNATITQMKMFLTRLGANAKAIVTGDITQIDLPDKTTSGLINANTVLQKIKGIEFVYFDKSDIVRHRLVADIIRAYEKDEKKKQLEKNRMKEKENENE